MSPRARALGILAMLLLVDPSAADDRVELTPPDPYVFVIFDTSSSFTTSPACTRDQARNDFDPFDAQCTTVCPLETADCAKLCPDRGCAEYDFSSISPPGTVPTIILTDGDAGVTDSGWQPPVVEATAYLGGTYLHDNPPAPDADFGRGTRYCGDLDRTTTAEEFRDCAEAEFDPVAAGLLSLAGDYMIFLWWPEVVGDFIASNTLVDVQHVDPDDATEGAVTTLTVDQRFDTGQWNAIGTFTIDPAVAGAGGVVTIRNENANGIASADAVGWLPVTVPSCVGPEVYRCQQPICNEGGCFTSNNGDDPRSKFFQAKQALYEVIDEIPGIRYGFATFEQDELVMEWKHWRYRIVPGQTLPTLAGVPFLEDGAEEVFGNSGNNGDGWSCQTGGFLRDGRIGCTSRWPIDLRKIEVAPGADEVFTAPWEVLRGRRRPKLGWDGNAVSDVWYRVDRDNNEKFRVSYSAPGGVNLGDDVISVQIEVFECPAGTCPAGAGETRTVDYELIGDYVAIDGAARRDPMSGGGFYQGQRNIAGNTGASCEGLENNDERDPMTDLFPPLDNDPFTPSSTPAYNLRWPTTTDARGERFDLGDFVPLDWRDGHRSELLGRLAPNVAAGSFTPDFRAAVYFADSLDPADSSTLADRLLRLRDEDLRPILAFGDTPLGDSLREFQIWYENGTGQGWADEAETDDEAWTCRQKALLILTDGAEECWDEDEDGNPATPPVSPDSNGYNSPCGTTAGIEDAMGNPLIGYTEELYDPSLYDPSLMLSASQETDRKVTTFVVGYSIPDASTNALQCMVDHQDPADGPYLFLPEDQTELASSLRGIIAQLTQQSQTFASAALPAIQSTAADNIYLSRFFPLVSPARSVWPGRLDAFRQPLPLDMNGEPDITRSCTAPDPDLQSACFSWEAGAQLCQQAPDANVVDIEDPTNSDFKLGALFGTQRRVLYGQAADGSRPNSLRLFSVPAMPADPPAGDPNPVLGTDAEDLAEALDPLELASYQADATSPSELQDFFEEVIGETLRLKVHGLDPMDPDFPSDIGGCDTTGDGVNDSYVLGDVFHANPVPILSPSNFTYFANNTGVGAVDGPQRYRTFARDNVWRRRMLATGTNDGQLHFFDIGIRQLVDNNLTPDPSDKLELFNDGTGHELFSYIPRSVLPIVRHQAGSNDHVFSLDGTVALGDVFIDPQDAGGGATPAERQWRTVLVGGLREGGTVFPDGDKVRNFKSGYFALDVTQPDILNARSASDDPSKVPCPASNDSCDETTTGLPTEWVPSCLSLDYGTGAQSAPPAGCGSLPFPLELWTFDDSIEVTELQVPPADDGEAPNDEVLTFYLDEDANGVPDLADSWSRPVIGQIRVCPATGTNCDLAGDASDLEVVEVAIFGGGMDAERKGATDVGGNYLYMVNVETGDLIYKRRLECPAVPAYAGCKVGSAAGDPAVIDENRDGYFDYIYIGTTGGFLYKVDLTQPSAASISPARDVPQLLASSSVDTEQLVLLDPLGNPTRFVDEYGSPPPVINLTQPGRITDTAWDPFVILDTEGTPIYHAPTAFFIPPLNDYGLAVGTGDREDLRDEDNSSFCTKPASVSGRCARFWLIVDEDLVNDPAAYAAATTSCEDKLPIQRACLTNIAFDDDPDLSANYLLDPQPDVMINPTIRKGWTLLAPPTTRVTNEAFVVAGILIFPAFSPDITVNGPGDCERSGETRVFVTSVNNAGPVAPIGNETDPSILVTTGVDPGERNIDRYQVLDEFITAPFISNTATKNPDATGDTILDEIDDAVTESVRDALLGQYPRGSRFNKAYSLVIAALRKSVGLEVFATVPVAVYPADWKDQ